MRTLRIASLIIISCLFGALVSPVIPVLTYHAMQDMGHPSDKVEMVTVCSIIMALFLAVACLIMLIEVAECRACRAQREVRAADPCDWSTHTVYPKDDDYYTHNTEYDVVWEELTESVLRNWDDSSEVLSDNKESDMDSGALTYTKIYDN